MNMSALKNRDMGAENKTWTDLFARWSSDLFCGHGTFYLLRFLIKIIKNFTYFLSMSI